MTSDGLLHEARRRQYGRTSTITPNVLSGPLIIEQSLAFRHVPTCRRCRRRSEIVAPSVARELRTIALRSFDQQREKHELIFVATATMDNLKWLAKRGGLYGPAPANVVVGWPAAQSGDTQSRRNECATQHSATTLCRAVSVPLLAAGTSIVNSRAFMTRERGTCWLQRSRQSAWSPASRGHVLATDGTNWRPTSGLHRTGHGDAT